MLALECTLSDASSQYGCAWHKHDAEDYCRCTHSGHLKGPTAEETEPIQLLDEAIEHAEEVATRCEGACRQEHRQLAVWLRELQTWRTIANPLLGSKEGFARLLPCDLVNSQPPPWCPRRDEGDND